MFREYESVKTILDGFGLSHYGYGRYLEKGFVSPSQSLLAPKSCFDEGYGDCDVIGAHLAKLLSDHDVPSTRLEAWFVNLPLILLSGQRAFMQHTLPVVHDNDKTYFLGFTPYDYLINGRIGVFEQGEYGVPLQLRHKMGFKEHRRKVLTQRLRMGYLTLKGSSLSVGEMGDAYIILTSGLSWPDGDGEKIIILDMICQTDMCCPVGWHKDGGVFVEMAVLRGESAKGHILGYRVDLCQDVFDSAEKALHTKARRTVFLVMPTRDLPELRKVVANWNPSQTLERLLTGDRPSFLEVRTEENQHPELLETALMSCGDDLHHAILHTYTEAYGANDIKATDVYHAITLKKMFDSI